jgi:hypothetical protein
LVSTCLGREAVEEVVGVVTIASTVMQDEPLMVDECDELAEALRERAASLSNGSERKNLLKLAECFRELANIKRSFLRKVN